MKRLIISFFIIMLLAVPVLASSYTLPGTDPIEKYKHHNNIGIRGELTIDLNVTLINTAPFPKFVMINPRYDFKIYRNGYNEYMYGVRNNEGTTIHYINDFSANTLNYHLGFWIRPYETVVVNFQITDNTSYLLNLADYKSLCGGGQITNLTFINGSVVNGKVNVDETLSNPICDVFYPQIINTPQVVDITSILPLIDGYVKILKYSGVVNLKLINVPDESNEFWSLFGISLPVIFSGAAHYDFKPNYTMTYNEYMEKFVQEYKGINIHPERREKPPESLTANMFSLTDNLLTGISTPTLTHSEEKTANFMDYPIWIFWLGKNVDIKYHVSWNNEEKVSLSEGEKEKVWIILDRGNFERR